MKIIKMIAAAVLLVGSLFAQTSQVPQIPVQDISVGSPLSISGTSANVLGTNNTSKDILAYVVVFQADNSPSVTYAHDHYFKPMVLMAGTTDTIIELDPRSHLDLSLAVRAKVGYLQFVDGSTWGDVTLASTMLADREAKSQFLNQMHDAYANGGQAGLMQLLNSAKQDDQKPPTIRGMVGRMLSQAQRGGMASVVDEVNSRLAAAAQHNKAMKP